MQPTGFDAAADDAALARRIVAAAPAIDRAAEAELCRRFAPRIRLYGLKHLRGNAAAADLAFDRAANEIVDAPSIADLRRLGVATQHVQLLSVADGAENVIADYTFNHSPHRANSPPE